MYYDIENYILNFFSNSHSYDVQYDPNKLNDIKVIRSKNKQEWLKEKINTFVYKKIIDNIELINYNKYYNSKDDDVYVQLFKQKINYSIAKYTLDIHSKTNEEPNEPLAEVMYNKEEETIAFQSLARYLTDYKNYKIKEYTGMSFIEYINIPIQEIKVINHKCFEFLTYESLLKSSTLDNLKI